MELKKNYKFWFATGSQDLYGDECLSHVAKHAQIIVQNFNESGILPFEVVWKPTLIDSTSIRRTFEEANADEECAGVITWMHTFSPAKSWIAGLQAFKKPLLHLHTQFNEEIPYDTIDMDFMNENQSAHGDREFGHIVTRMGIPREVVVGYYESKEVKEKIASWMRSAIGMVESKNIRVVRIADNMIPARLELLQEQMNALKEQKAQIESTVERLAYKISKYEEAMETGVLVWDESGDCHD